MNFAFTKLTILSICLSYFILAHSPIASGSEPVLLIHADKKKDEKKEEPTGKPVVFKAKKKTTGERAKSALKTAAVITPFLAYLIFIKMMSMRVTAKLKKTDPETTDRMSSLRFQLKKQTNKVDAYNLMDAYYQKLVKEPKTSGREFAGFAKLFYERFSNSGRTYRKDPWSEIDYSKDYKYQDHYIEDKTGYFGDYSTTYLKVIDVANNEDNHKGYYDPSTATTPTKNPPDMRPNLYYEALKKACATGDVEADTYKDLGRFYAERIKRIQYYGSTWSQEDLDGFPQDLEKAKKYLNLSIAKGKEDFFYSDRSCRWTLNDLPTPTELESQIESQTQTQSYNESARSWRMY